LTLVRNYANILGIDMPAVEVIFYQDAQGKMPRLIEWLDALSPKARIKCLVRLKRLEDLRHELRRPEADGGNR
jgi:hypothetical protein